MYSSPSGVNLNRLPRPVRLLSKDSVLRNFGEETWENRFSVQRPFWGVVFWSLSNTPYYFRGRNVRSYDGDLVEFELYSTDSKNNAYSYSYERAEKLANVLVTAYEASVNPIPAQEMERLEKSKLLIKNSDLETETDLLLVKAELEVLEDVFNRYPAVQYFRLEADVFHSVM